MNRFRKIRLLWPSSIHIYIGFTRLWYNSSNNVIVNILKQFYAIKVKFFSLKLSFRMRQSYWPICVFNFIEIVFSDIFSAKWRRCHHRYRVTYTRYICAQCLLRTHFKMSICIQKKYFFIFFVVVILICNN